ncbi:MAG TPA: hypothetical protein VGP72_10705 [Planctomycetota bacterium]
MGKKKRQALPLELAKSRSRAAAMAAATRGRAKVIDTSKKKSAVPPARKQIEEQLKESEEGKPGK